MENYNKEKALEQTQKDYPHLFRKTTMTGMSQREKRNEKYMARLNLVRDMRYKEFKTLQEIGDSLKPKITRQAVKDLLKNHFPLEQLITGLSILKARVKKDRFARIEKGDRVWFLMPHNGTIQKIHDDGSFTIKPDAVKEDTLIGEFGKDEVTKI